MQTWLLSVRSLTYAQRGVRYLERNGLYSALSRIPAQLNVTGCRYAITVKAGEGERAVQLLRSAGIEVQRAAGKREDGTWEVWAL